MSGVDKSDHNYNGSEDDLFDVANKFLEDLHHAILGEYAQPEPQHFTLLGTPMSDVQFEVEDLDMILSSPSDDEMSIVQEFVLDPLDKGRNESTVSESSSASTPISGSGSNSPPTEFVYRSAFTAFLQQLDAIPHDQPLLNENGQVLLLPQDIQQIKNFVKSHANQLHALQPMDLEKVRQEVERISNAFEQNMKTSKQVNQELLDLWKPYTLRISYRDQAGLPRTIDITFDHEARLRFMIHTNQKVVSPTGSIAKDSGAKLGKGSFKRVKTIVNAVDSSLEPIARLQSEVPSPNDLLNLIKEMIFAQSHRNSEYVDAPFIGSLYFHKIAPGKYNLACYVYSKKALCSLQNLEDIEDNRSSPNFGKPKFLTAEELQQIQEARKNGELPAIYRDLFHDALKGLDEIHAAGQIHRDIKPENIFVYRDVNGRLHAKISDPGLATTLAAKKSPVATYTFAAPQAFYANTAGEFYTYFFVDNAKKLCIGKLMYEHSSKTTGFTEQERLADPTDDIYALGVSLLEKFSGRGSFFDDTPGNRILLAQMNAKFVKNCSEFASMLSPDRTERPTTTALLSEMDKPKIAADAKHRG